MKFGCCTSQLALLGYLAVEGWILGVAKCTRCNHEWNMVVDMFKTSKETQIPIHKLGTGSFYYAGQPCTKCGKEFVRVTLPKKEVSEFAKTIA